MAQPEPTPRHEHRLEAGRTLPMLVWRFDRPVRAIASGPLGGGVGSRRWALNATVDKGYARMDPDRHLVELARALGLPGDGIGMVTAVDVTEPVAVSDGGVSVVATVGLGHPTWAAADDDHIRHEWPGTINLAVWVPVRLSDAALVNAVATATEAKVQALWEYGAQATGTASDALFVACPESGDIVEPYGGPRSTWGARLARAVHSAVARGTRQWYTRSA